MNSDHYMDKLRTIREKYGCSQSNKTPFMHRSSYADKLNPETTFNDRKKMLDKSSDISSYTNIQNKISVAAGTPYSYNTPFGIN